MKKLHIKLIDSFGNVIYDNFIDHIDAVNGLTLCYETGFKAHQSKVIRLIETINNILITSEGVKIIYVSGSELFITRVRA